jgi:hypothetical protein
VRFLGVLGLGGIGARLSGNVVVAEILADHRAAAAIASPAMETPSVRI